MTKADTTKAKPAQKLTWFRVHFRKSDSDARHKMDAQVTKIGDAHDAVRKAHQTDKVRVFIDKTSVLGEDT